MDENEEEKVVKKEETIDSSKTEETAKEAKVEKDTETKKRKGASKKVVIIVLVLIIIAFLGVGGYLLFLAPKNLDMSKYIKVTYDGYNEHATATVEIDTKALGEFLDDKSLAKKFAKKAELKIENEAVDLANGDELEIEIDISSSWLENNRLKLKDKDVKIQVQGLDGADVIDMSKYLEVEYEGFNKDATAKVTISKSLKDDLRESSLYSSFVQNASLEIKDNENLANGDKLEVTISLPTTWLEENGLEIKESKVKIEVKGLEEATEVDVFKDININISGMSPNLKVSVTTNSTDEFVRTVKFTASKTSGLSNGEKITITASDWDEEMAKTKKLVLKSKTMDYTISGQAAYISKTSELTETVLNSIKTKFIEKARSAANEDDGAVIRDYTDYKYSAIIKDNYYANEEDLTIGEPTIMSLYLLTKKEDAYSDDINMVIGIVRVPFTSKSTGVTYNWYFTVKAKNVSVTADGVISENAVYDTTKHSGEDEERAYTNHVNSEKDDYNVDKVSF